MNKKLKNALAVTGAVAVAAAAVYGLNVLDEKRDRRRYPQSGRMVEVRGRRMHVYTSGSGANTIVMITGKGTPTPSLDFKPLADRLSDSYRVAIPEPFGYGYSDKTGEARSVQNVVSELREGLRKAGILPPYVLMAHAVGGITALYWASHYPREVASVIGIDSALPAQGGDFTASRPLRKAAAFLTRFTPLRFFIKAGLIDSRLREFTGGDDSKLPAVRSHAANIRTSAAAVNELLSLPASCAEVAGLNYPASCPVLMLVSSESCEMISSASGASIDWLGEHEKIAMHSPKGKCVVLSGGHYLHHAACADIESEIRSFVPPEEAQAPALRSFFSRK